MNINYYTKGLIIKRCLGIMLIPIVLFGGIIILIFDNRSTSWKEIKITIEDFWNGNYERIF